MWLTNIKKIMRKGRAVSPIIATILLLGITVLAAAAFFIVINNFLATSPKIDFLDSSSIAIGYSNSLTTANGTNGWGILQAEVRNNGNAAGNIVNISVLYSYSTYKGVVNGTLLQIPSSASLPLSLGPNAQQNIQVAFPLVETIKVGSSTVDINEQHTTAYILKITTSQGFITSDTKVATSLGADSPQLSSLPQQHTNVSGIAQFFPGVTVPSGGTVTQVAYTIANSTYTATIGTITSPDFSISWNSRMAGQSQPGNNHFTNGVYNLTITATNNAGISTTSAPIAINIANDYYKPYLTNTPIVIDTQSNTAAALTNNAYKWGQQGYAAQVRVNVADNIAQVTCTSASCSIQNNVTNPTVDTISTVVLNYKLANTSLYTATTMINWQNGTYTANIPPSTTAFGVNTTFYFVVTDSSGNQYSTVSVNRTLMVHDTIPPTVVISNANGFNAELKTNLVISATLADSPGSGINPTTATLYYARGSSSSPPPQGSTYNYTSMIKQVSSCTGSCVYTGTIPSSAITFTSSSQSYIYYYVGVTDYASNTNTTDGSPHAPYLAQIRDTTPPTVSTFTAVTSTEFGVAVNIDIPLADKGQVSNATLYYRLQGTSSFISSPMDILLGNSTSGTWEGFIYTVNFTSSFDPQTNITLQYYITAFDNATPANELVVPSLGQYSLVVYDKEAPVISFSPIIQANLNTNLNISATITDNYKVQGAILYYRLNGAGSWYSQSMASPYNNDFYSTSINTGTNSSIQYYIFASDFTPNVVYAPSTGQSAPYSMSISSQTLVAGIVKLTGFTPQPAGGRGGARWIQNIYIANNVSGNTININAMQINLTNSNSVSNVYTINFGSGTPARVFYGNALLGSKITITLTPVTGTAGYQIQIQFNRDVWSGTRTPYTAYWTQLSIGFFSGATEYIISWTPTG